MKYILTRLFRFLGVGMGYLECYLTLYLKTFISKKKKKLIKQRYQLICNLIKKSSLKSALYD